MCNLLRLSGLILSKKRWVRPGGIRGLDYKQVKHGRRVTSVNPAVADFILLTELGLYAVPGHCLE